MRSLRSSHLILAAVSVSLLAEISFALSSSGYQSFESSIKVAYLLIALNTAIAVAGLWTRHRVAWAAYLAASVALTLLIGAVTPLSVFGIMARLFA